MSKYEIFFKNRGTIVMVMASEMIEGKKYRCFCNDRDYGIRIRFGNKSLDESGCPMNSISGYTGKGWNFIPIEPELKTVKVQDMIEGKRYKVVVENRVTEHIRIRKGNRLYTGTGKPLALIKFYLNNNFVLAEESETMETMNFIEACEKMRHGKKVYRKGWNNFNDIGYFQMKDYKIVNDSNLPFAYYPQDITANDWYVVDEKILLKDAKPGKYKTEGNNTILVPDNVDIGLKRILRTSDSVLVQCDGEWMAWSDNARLTPVV
jgi:hypothetical protein